ncbi:MAG: polysaccharide biosynthesis protein [Alphaproteobacteria bacterium]|nr:polysaccharide biosynthesis protein [Alphaproteobacteria bacterium]
MLTIGLGPTAEAIAFSQRAGAPKLDGVFLSDASEGASLRLDIPVLGQLNDAEREIARLDPACVATLVWLDRAAAPPRYAGMLLRLAATGRRIVRAAAEGELVDVLDTIRGKGRALALSHLLRRETADLAGIDPSALVRGANVLVTGAGGSIGSEICLTLARFGCARLTMLDASEHNLFTIDRRIAAAAPHLERRLLLCDIRDRKRIVSAIAREQPTIVFHAAALKHVPMVEAHPSEGVLTNLVGTRNVVDACVVAGVQSMLFVSTDKAVQPTSVMGLTKRLAEDYVRARDLDCLETGGPRFVSVRFGNVFGTSGSVAPIFAEQIERGGPVTVTHQDMERFFMTPQEAVLLTLRAMMLGLDDAERACGLYVLEMGEPIRIVEFAERMIEAYGLKPGVDVKISVVGARPGEKLTEALVDDDESGGPSAAEGVTRVHATPLALPRDLLAQFEAAARDHDDTLVRRLLADIRARRSTAVA